MDDYTEQERINCVQTAVNIQCADGAWNYDPYMHGLANGLLLALAIMRGEDPQYKQAPRQWLRDQDN